MLEILGINKIVNVKSGNILLTKNIQLYNAIQGVFNSEKKKKVYHPKHSHTPLVKAGTNFVEES